MFINAPPGNVWVFRAPEDKIKKEFVIFLSKGALISGMVWGAIWHEGRLALHIFDELGEGKKVNTAVHKKALEAFMLTINQSGTIFQQDNAPSHKTVVVKSFFLLITKFKLLKGPLILSRSQRHWACLGHLKAKVTFSAS